MLKKHFFRHSAMRFSDFTCSIGIFSEEKIYFVALKLTLNIVHTFLLFAKKVIIINFKKIVLIFV